jgi:hypothetical protein
MNVEYNLIISVRRREEKYNLTYKGRCEEELVHKFFIWNPNHKSKCKKKLILFHIQTFIICLFPSCEK